MIIDTAVFQKKLEEEKVLLLGELASVGRINPDDPKDWEVMAEDLNVTQADSNERADEITDFEDRSSIEFTLEERLNAVDNALTRIKENRYGICEVCQHPIDAERLAADTAAHTCRAHMG